jgi:HK97 gp10 family phage protein
VGERVSVEVKGLGKLLDQLNKLQAELAAKVLAQAGRKAFKPVLDAAKAMAPKDSGDLADSLKLSVVKPTSENGVLKVGIKIGVGRGSKQAKIAAAAFGEAQSKALPPARRWHFIELGTSKQAAHPYLRPALEHNSGEVLELLKGELQKAIFKVVNK